MSGLFERALDKLDKDDDEEVVTRPRRRPRPAPADDNGIAPGQVIDPEVVAGAAPAAEPAEPPERAPAPVVPPAPPPRPRPHADDAAQQAAAPAPASAPRKPESPPSPRPLAEPTPTPPQADATARTSRHVELDVAALTAAGLVTPDSSSTPLAEQHRVIKRPLLLKAFPPTGKRLGNENVVLVTSSVPAEGKTFIATNLAMSIAMEVDRTVLLVDGDSAKGNVSRTFGLQAERGLTDYLRDDELELADVLVRTNIANLTLLPAGGHVANVTELLSSEQMHRLTDELANRYNDRLVIIDSPPLLATSGARVLAGLAGQIVFVVEAVRTTQHAVREALQMIESHPNVGLVLNKSRERPRGSYQYGYYGAED